MLIPPLVVGECYPADRENNRLVPFTLNGSARDGASTAIL